MKLTLEFGHAHTQVLQDDTTVTVKLSSKVLGERNSIDILEGITKIQTDDTTTRFSGKGFNGAIYMATDLSRIRTLSKEIYQDIFTQTQNQHLLRIWNFIPHITEQINGEEIYRLFNEGRAESFEEQSNAPHRLMPAATGIDIHADELIIIYLAGINHPHHYTNPLQVSPYHYPSRYGKKSPSFARATKAQIGTTTYDFISGTASIRGHESLYAGNIKEQLRITIENIDFLSKKLHLSTPLRQQQAIVYLRNEQDYRTARNIVEQHPLLNEAIYLNADICRKDLDVEISLLITE